MSQHVAKSMSSLTTHASLAAISCWLSAWPGKMDAFKDCPSTRVHQTGLKKRSQWLQFTKLCSFERLPHIYAYTYICISLV